MKKNIFGLSLCAVALSGLMMVSCETETVYEVAAVPSLTVSAAVTVDYEGGSYSCNYSVSNPADDGIVECFANVSWISDVTDNGSSVSFSVASNTAEQLRNGEITVRYTYEGGSISKTVGVIQSAFEDPVLTVPLAVTVSSGGGTGSFTYSVTNAVDGGDLKWTAEESWVHDFDYSTYGIVSFTVDANDTEELRSCDLTVTYTYSLNGSSKTLTKTVLLVQNHPGVDVSDFVGTYSCTGIVSNDDYYDNNGNVVSGQEPGVQSTWTMKAYASDNGLILDGLVPDIVDYYPDYPYYIAQASVSGSNILVYPQFTGYYGTFSFYSGDLYICWVLCPSYYATDAEAEADGYSSSGFYITYSSNYPCWFSSTGTDTWTSDNGLFLALSTSSTSLSDIYTFYDVFAPGLVITKTSSSTSSLTTTDSITHPIDEHLLLHKDFLLAK
ncbi:MAG: hypothetical protein LUC24_07305 [Bacteroidales bacterium]|nr:hypothetical protein [Bacteroidales bacterium]